MEHLETDAVIRERLAAVTPEMWDGIAAVRDRLAGGGPFGSWAGGEPDGAGAIQMPYAVEGPEIAAAREAMTRAGLFVAYDWMGWPRRSELLSDPGLWPGMTPEEGVRMWVALARSARFDEGSLLAAAESGLVAAALDAVLRARPAG